MGTTLNKKAYQRLIDENIEALEKHMPEHSLEKKHTIEVLKWSVVEIYEQSQKTKSIVKEIEEMDKLLNKKIANNKRIQNDRMESDKTRSKAWGKYVAYSDGKRNLQSLLNIINNK